MDKLYSDITRYKVLQREKGMNISIPKIIAFIPNPNENDYRRGYLTRYFIQKINDKNAPIIEVSDSNVSVIIAEQYYKLVTILWKIRGTTTDVHDSNKKSILSVKKDLPKLKLYLPNLLQFAKIEEFG